ncbi:MAG: sugar ABC transporter substrate-binding protein [Actinobacteria bacterium]|nr:sugar ABC transporter substrate-binding protein [Actinomycetota bacterium]
MRRVLGLGVALVLCTALAVGAANASRTQEPVKISFATYVWQPTTVVATKQIVEAFNRSHPGIQVSILPVDVNSVHDKLLTSFVGGTAADVIHDEAADIAGFTQQGYLANLTPMIPKSLKASIPQAIWNTVNYGGKITGVPSLLQTYNVFANMTILRAAGIKAPTLDKPWTWPVFRANAKKLTKDGQYGVCWGLRSPTAAIQTMSLNYGGQFFYLEKGRWEFKFGPNDQNVVRQMRNMIQVDKSVDPAATGLSGSAVLPAFFGGKCAMTVQGNFQAQGMIQQSPKGFNWAMFPLLKGKTQEQVANPQTFSISEQSKNKQAAMTFIAYLLNKQNMAKLAQGDWLIPASPEAGKIARRSTNHAGSWRVATASVVHFRKGNWVALAAYARWKSEVATPQFVQYLKGSISLEELGKNLSDGWSRVRG